MTPYARMRAWYKKHPGPLSFGEYVAMHLEDGVVVSTEEFFVMGRAVNSRAEPWIGGSMRCWPREEQDAWYIFAMCGDPRLAWRALPYHLPLVCFNRRGQKNLRFYPLPRMSDLCGKLLPQ